MKRIIIDTVAEKLEQAGLWRRAAARWLDVMQQDRLTDEQREWVSRQRRKCLSRVTPQPSVRVNLDIMAVRRAADVTQKEMGIDQPRGAAFRLKYPT